MSFSWRNSLRVSTVMKNAPVRSIGAFLDETSNLPVYTRILNYEENLKKLILNVALLYNNKLFFH